MAMVKPEGENRIRLHIPAFDTGTEPAEATFLTIDDLMSVPFVARFRAVAEPDKLFHRFSYSAPHGDEAGLLICEYDEGRSWWVVGYLRAPVEGLPLWEPPASRSSSNRKGT